MTADRKTPTQTTNPSGVSEKSYADAVAEEVAALWALSKFFIDAVAGTNDVTGAADPTLAQYERGNTVCFVAANTNAGSMTIDIDGLGQKDLVDIDGDPLLGGEVVAGRLHFATYNGTHFRLLPYSGVGGGESSGVPGAVFEDRKANGTAGGSITAATWNDRDLNTTVRNEIPGASLDTATGIITLQAGDYFIRYSTPGYALAGLRARFYNVDDAATEGIGDSIQNTAYDFRSHGVAVVSISAAKTFKVQSWSGTTRATDGKGRATSSGINEVYSRVEIWQIGQVASEISGVDGGAITIPYTFSTETGQADPGDGKLRLNAAAMDGVTEMYADLLANNLEDWTNVLDTIDGGRCRLVKADDFTKWVIFTVESRTTQSGYREYGLAFIASSEDGNSPNIPFADGDDIRLAFGTPGPAALITAVSTTSQTIGTGSKTVTTDAGRSWNTGTRLRLASDSDPGGTFMEGVVTGYTTDQLTVLIDTTSGSGAHADWSINIVGQPGAVVSINGETGVVTLTADDIGYTPAGNIAATDVEAALNELDTEKLALAGGTMSGAIDMNANEIILDLDGDTSITADTDDQIDVRVGGSDVAQFLASSLLLLSGYMLDVDANEIVLDGDGDTSITADTDDQIDFRIGGADSIYFNADGIGIGTVPGATRNLHISDATPIVTLTDSDGAADNKNWEFLVVTEQFQFRVVDDLLGSPANVFTVDRTGAAVDSITFATLVDLDGNELVLDADGDTSLTADTDDQIDVRVGGSDVAQFLASSLLLGSGYTLDLNGNELILDADGDTSITADTDDRIDFKIGGGQIAFMNTTGLGIGNAPSSGRHITIEQAAPAIHLKETGVTADNTVWEHVVDGEAYSFRLGNDALSAFQDVYTVQRTANTVDSITFNAALFDINGGELVLDADADTSLHASTDDQIDVKIGGADDFLFGANVFRALSGSAIETNTINETTAAAGVTIDSLLVKDGGLVAAGAIDANGQELILDLDGDTSITADTDDQIDVKIGGFDDFRFVANSFLLVSGSNIDLDGNNLIVDADADTIISAGSDDILNFAVGGTNLLRLTPTGIEAVLSGSAAAPVFTFDGDENTGIYRATTDVLAFATAGVERMSIDASGEVGIGPHSGAPAALLHLLTNPASTNTVVYPFRVDRRTTGVPAAGLGVGIEFRLEDSIDENQAWGYLEFVATAVTHGAEAADFIFKPMVAQQQIERFRVASTITAAAPTLTMNGDTDTGLFPQAANVIGVAIAGVERYRLDGSAIHAFGTAASQGQVRLYEDTDNGANYAAIQAPASIPASFTLTLPDTDGDADQILKSDGSGNLSWTDFAAEGVVEAGANITDHALVRGDGGAKGVQDTGITVDDSDVMSGLAAIAAEDAGTATVLYPLQVRRTSSGTPAAGIGAGIQLVAETAAGNNEIGAAIEAVTTDVTSAQEDFDLVWKLMEAGAAAAERMRLTSAGNLTVSGTVEGRDIAADGSKLDGIESGADVTDATNVAAAGAVMEADFNANTILAATSDDTPAALTVAEQTLVGRITAGSIAALTATQARTLINVEDGADVTDATNVAAAGAVMDSDISAAEGFLRKTGAGAYEAIKSNLAASTDPTTGDDSGDGYAVGSIWANTTDGKYWVCLDATLTAAVWKDATASASGITDIVEDVTPQLGGALDGQGFDLNNLGVIFLTEQAAAEADVAGKGQFWVKTATPNLPMFTDDAGSDFSLANFEDLASTSNAKGASLIGIEDSAGNFTSNDVEGALAEAAASGGAAENLVINGGFRIAQRGTTFDATTNYPNSDDTYTLDRWLLLSDGNDILDISQETTTVPDQSYAAVKLDVETANKRAGLAQIIEARDARAAIGDVVSLSFKARAGGSNATVDTVRAIIASWSSTEDVVTSDLVSVWSTEGSNPTLATNWTIEGSGTFALTGSYQEFTLENVAIDTASTKNIAALLMIENDDGTVGDLVYIADVNLVVGATAQRFVANNIADEQNRCQRFFEAYSSEDEANVLFAIGQAHSPTDGSFATRFRTEKRVVPTFSVSAVSDWAYVNAGFSLFEQWTSITNTFLAKWGGRISAQGSSGNLVAGNATMLLPSSPGATNARMYFDAEL